jgi:hypothetical protein
MSIAMKGAIHTTITTMTITTIKVIIMATPIILMTRTAISPRSCWPIPPNSATGTLK